jgi:hypothetical protein
MKTAYSRLRVWKTLAFPLIMPTVFTGIVFGQLSPKNVSITVQEQLLHENVVDLGRRLALKITCRCGCRTAFEALACERTPLR